MNAALRQQLETDFQQHIPDEHGLAQRNNYAEFLTAVGLSAAEANALLDTVGLAKDVQISCKEFLDSVFGGTQATPTEADKAEVSSSMVEIETEVKAADAKTEEDRPELRDEASGRGTEEKEILVEDKADPPPQNSKAVVEKDEDESKQESKPDSDEGKPESQELFHDYMDLFDDDNFMNRFNGIHSVPRLVNVIKGKTFASHELLSAWIAKPIANWPPRMPPCRRVNGIDADPTKIGKSLCPVKVSINPGLVGRHARGATSQDCPIVDEVLCEQYRVEKVVGAGHFTRAYLAYDIVNERQVCVKRHHGLTIDLLSDLLTIGKRLESVDPEGKAFPRLVDAFFDMVGFTVESLMDGCNCLEKLRANPLHFKDIENLRIVARGGMSGLKLLDEAGVVHADVKPDNIMWIDSKESGPSVKIVDFGCSRLDRRLESGRNWALAEGGAGHLGKWAPEMVLRLAITARADVWGFAIALLELYSGRFMWNGEADTAEFILAQSLGLANARDGLPEDLLRRSPLDIRQLYTPSPSYFPVQRVGASHKELRPETWGLECVLGAESGWDAKKKVFADLVTTALVLDHEERPSAAELLDHAFIKPEIAP
eukprot:TRINITY_DN7387_c0_g5_i1.p1 TRINITY_DN7387_c0_g5~~TRINITY_DN7387_c0_g5_i1.p1  ORF type:complete len:599 (+),score=127.73 TRINITY_DN7387_c0_g5_i1:109-1905(+)